MITEKDLKSLLQFFKDEDIILVCGDMVGEINLPEVDEEYIYDRIMDENALEEMKQEVTK